MLDIGTPELLVFAVILIGIIAPIVGRIIRRVDTRTMVIALVLAIVVPVIGSVAAIVITAVGTRPRATSADSSRSLGSESEPLENLR